MNNIPIQAKADFLERLSNTSPIKAVSELIWNGFDANAYNVSVQIETNKLDGIEKIRVIDTGEGMRHDRIPTLFGDLGNSWKKTTGRYKGRALHGKSGQGRFKAFALGKSVEWHTVYNDNGENKQYRIFGRSDSLTNFQFTEPIIANGNSCGTEVIISNISQSHGSLLRETARGELAKIFAAYLNQYPDVKIEYDGVLVDPRKLQIAKKDVLLENITLSSGKKINATITIVEWAMPTKRIVYLCDKDGITLQELDDNLKIRAPGFEFTVHIKSDYIKELDAQGILLLDGLHPDLVMLADLTKTEVKIYYRKKLVSQQSEIVQRWKQEQIYPFEEKTQLNAVEEAERQVFDILAVNVESYLPVFEESDPKSKRFMFRLLAQALQKNPESVQRIITEMLNLKKEEQEALSDLLEVTSLSSVISSAKTVANRLNFILALENLINDQDTKKKLLERDQLHKILENEAWIFNEEFALSGSEKTLEEVLELHLGILRPKKNNRNKKVTLDPIFREGNKKGRVDLMLSRMRKPRHDERDHLVIELKRPLQPINSEILSQVESYALAVAQDSRFVREKTRWRFIVVSNEMDEHAQRKAAQKNRPRGLVFDDADYNIQVWAFEWNEIIASARTRLEFINESLSYEANRETSRKYLEKTHAKFIPKLIDEFTDKNETLEEQDEQLQPDVDSNGTSDESSEVKTNNDATNEQSEEDTIV